MIDKLIDVGRAPADAKRFTDVSDRQPQLPTPAEIARLRTERDELASKIAVLNQRGARADLRRCGPGRACVRVDLSAPRYGESSDYMVIKGY